MRLFTFLSLFVAAASAATPVNDKVDSAAPVHKVSASVVTNNLAPAKEEKKDDEDTAMIMLHRFMVFNLPGPSSVASAQSLQGSTKDAKSLQNRVSALEYSYNLLAQSYEKNLEEYTSACANEIATYCKNDEDSYFWSLCGGYDSDSSKCLVANQDVLSSKCMLGLMRYSNWMNLHSQYYPQGVPSLFTFFYVTLALFVFLSCCRACCLGCRRRALAKKRTPTEVHEEIPTVTVIPLSKKSLQEPVIKATIVKA